MRAAVQAQSVQISSTQLRVLPAVKGRQLNAVIVGKTRLQIAEQFGRILLKVNADGSQVRLKGVAKNRLGRTGLRRRHSVQRPSRPRPRYSLSRRRQGAGIRQGNPQDHLQSRAVHTAGHKDRLLEIVPLRNGDAELLLYRMGIDVGVVRHLDGSARAVQGDGGGRTTRGTRLRGVTGVFRCL